MEAVFKRVAKGGASLISPSTRSRFRLQGRVVDVQRDGFLTTMDVSCWSFMRMAYLAKPLMKKGGPLFTMGSQRVVKNYNIMGVALEAAVRYMAAELGPKGIRVPRRFARTARDACRIGIPEFDALLDKARAKAPARSLMSIEDVGVATALLAHDAARLMTGETLYVDGGYHYGLVPRTRSSPGIDGSALRASGSKRH